jgi:hypothetical protein
MPELKPLKEISLSEVTPELERVSVIGKLKESNKDLSECVLEWKGFSLKVRFAEKSHLREVQKGDFLRIIGKPFNEGKEVFLFAELMQKLKGFNEELFERVKRFESDLND